MMRPMLVVVCNSAAAATQNTVVVVLGWSINNGGTDQFHPDQHLLCRRDDGHFTARSLHTHARIIIIVTQIAPHTDGRDAESQLELTTTLKSPRSGKIREMCNYYIKSKNGTKRYREREIKIQHYRGAEKEIKRQSTKKLL